ncbi:MAG: undecaprenyl-phosphate galactose phosphotransferase WbaP [Treponema sp.]|nr:undecaprenyl-phosphate galactose phosphotransferase WbaP [Treponema sp.]
MTAKEFSENLTKRKYHTSTFWTGFVFMLIDLVAIMVCTGIGFFIVNEYDRSIIDFKSFVTYAVYLPAFVLVFFVAKLYPGLMIEPATEVRRYSISSAFCFAGIAMSIMVEHDGRIPIIVALLIAIPFSILIMPAFREFGKIVFKRFNWYGIGIVIYAKGKSHEKTIKVLHQHKEYGYHPLLVVNDSCSYDEFEGVPIVKPSSELQAIIKKLKIKTAILVQDELIGTLNDKDKLFVKTNYRHTISIPKEQNFQAIGIEIVDFSGLLGMASTNRLKRRFNLFIKRCIDLLMIFVSAPVIIPVCLFIALCIKLSSKGPVFYGHERLGKNGKKFKAWKFRSMVIDADAKLKEILEKDPKLREEWKKTQKLENDPRITGIGKFLRKTSLDELPQLWNIFTGQMSFVGPRPIVDNEVKRYGDSFEYVFSVTPGLSGMWQISGRSTTDYNDRILLDTYYIQNWSIWLDIWIILKTVFVVLLGKGAY